MRAGSRSAILATTAALCVGCGTLLEFGASNELSDLHANGECAELIQRVDEYHPFISDRPDLLAQASYFKATCLANMGREEEAVAILQHVVDTWPESPYAPQSRVMLRGLQRVY